ncbi:S1 family peptidase [Nitrospira defluvii]|uniref:Serine protease n=1 Tax=Nitrospira defluvii TaxID=330214 RepID=A0ABN7KI94_9BACT|nr:serine protease [Nitrospira defluvii]CAE6694391.1 exported hypothetical protein [Nitrospira defluvii]
MAKMVHRHCFLILTLCLLSELLSISFAISGADDELKNKVVEILSNGEPVGAGLLITDKGHILTARHNIKNAPYTVQIKRYNKSLPETASVLSMSEHFDLALIAILPESLLVPMKIGDSSKVSAGEALKLIGSPAKNGVTRSFNVDVLPVKAVDNNGLIWLNGDLYPGNSGGPAVNSLGEVIGIVLRRSEVVSESFVLPISYAQHFLLSCGIWVEQGRVALYGSELSQIKKQLLTYQAMYAFMTTDLKWDASIFLQPTILPTAQPKGESGGGKREIKISYEKRFEGQQVPDKAMIKIFPLLADSFDRDKAEQQGLFMGRVVEFDSSGVAVISEVESSLDATLREYNRKTQSKLQHAEILSLQIEIVPERNDQQYSKTVLNRKYCPSVKC